MKVKYDPQATYVLYDHGDDYLRIVCEANNTSTIFAGEVGGHVKSNFNASLESIKTFLRMGYKIVQEWK